MGNMLVRLSIIGAQVGAVVTNVCGALGATQVQVNTITTHGQGLLCRGHEITHGVGINVSVDGMIRKVNSIGVGLTKVFATIVR